MKVRIDIDCTPEEARTFFGLPDLKPMQERMMAEVEERLRAMDPDALARMWMGGGVQGWEQLQKTFWSGLGGKGEK